MEHVDWSAQRFDLGKKPPFFMVRNLIALTGLNHSHTMPFVACGSQKNPEKCASDDKKNDDTMTNDEGNCLNFNR
jgi:hypothetical protein